MGIREKKSGKKPGGFQKFMHRNKAMVIGIGATVVAILIIAIVIGVLVGKNGAEPASADGETETASSETAQNETILMEEDAYPQVNALMQEFYQAVTDGDVDKIRSLSDSMDEEKLIYLQLRSAFIENYQNLKCYTKAGPMDNSYVVYASYDVKFQGIEVLVPGVSPYLVCTRDDGSLYIHEGEVDENVNSYLEEISAQDDVVDLYNRVQVKFNDAITEDEGLNNFLAQMNEELKVAVGEALAEAKANQTDAQSQDAAAQNNGNVTQVRAIDVVNVRVSDSEQADKIGKVQIGDVLPLIESKANGWTKVQYNGQEAYIKSEYLELVGAESDNSQQADNSTTQQSNTSSSGNTSLPASGKIKVGDTINIRESASQTANKLAVCYQGEELEIVMQQADGWTKVKYKGKTGYVKTDVLKVMD